jgi:hypothetical protein
LLIYCFLLKGGAACSGVKRDGDNFGAKRPLSRRESSITKPTALPENIDEDDRYYYMRPFELTLRRAVGAKKKGIKQSQYDNLSRVPWPCVLRRPVLFLNVTVYCKRNGLLAASLGDKSYQVPEYSRNFHKQGSTLPVVSFG